MPLFILFFPHPGYSSLYVAYFLLSSLSSDTLSLSVEVLQPYKRKRKKRKVKEKL
jgi:hypothetical protein